MKTLDKTLAFFGLDPALKNKPPVYEAIAQGLVITEKAAEVWFHLGTSNTDLAENDTLDAELDLIIKQARGALTGRDCQLKIVWGGFDGSDYRRQAERFYTTGNWNRWADEWAGRITEMGMLDRHILLGVRLKHQRPSRATKKLERKTSSALGLPTNHVPDAEMLEIIGEAQTLGRKLRKSVWKASLATPEMLSWMIARETHRNNSVVPGSGIIRGAELAQLTNSRILPYTDHLRVLDPAGRVARYAAIMTLSEFPEETEHPGDQDWLRTLGTITRDVDGHPQTVVADASIRFKILPTNEAKKVIEDARKRAKEQRRSAASHSAGETSEFIEEAEARMENVGKRIVKEKMPIVHQHPRIIVTGESYDDLMANADAVEAHFADISITARIAVDEQRDLWIEALPGDTVRVPDLGHVQNAIGFFGSFFWGGSTVGGKTGPVAGYLTGTSSGLARFSAVGGAKRGDGTTTAHLGRSGRGKTTGMMMDGAEAAFMGSWVPLLDFKGDLGGILALADEYELPHDLIQINGKYAGCADPFVTLPIEKAPEEVARQLALIAPKQWRHVAGEYTLAAAQYVAHQENPTSWDVIQHLIASESAELQGLGRALESQAKTELGSVIAGKPTGKGALRAEPGIWLVRFPALNMPKQGTALDDMDEAERRSLAVIRAFFAYAVHVSRSLELRTMPKLICVPEVHQMLKTSDGAGFLDETARMGRAVGTHLAIDSQDVEGVASHEGLAEQLTSVFLYQLTSRRQQDAAAELLRRDPSPWMRELIRGIGIAENEDDFNEDEFFHGVDPDLDKEDSNIRHGHCIFQDWNEEAATIQRTFPTQHVMDLLSTNPDAKDYYNEEEQEQAS